MLKLSFRKIFIIILLCLTHGVSAQEQKPAEAPDRPEERVDAANDEFVPLSEMKPLAPTRGYKNKHTFLYGLSAANTFIVDKASLPKGYYLGNYRPYFKYLWNEEHVFNIRAKLAYKNNPSITDAQEKAGVYRSTGEYSMELFNAELHFDRHEITAGRAFYKLGRGLLFSNFADGAEYSGNFKYANVKAWAAYSGQYTGCTISLGGCATNGDIVQKSPYDIVPGRPADANIADAGKRYFLAAEVQGPQLFGSSGYVVALYSRDMNRDKSAGTTNSGKYYAFDPLYIGLGLSGYIVSPRLRYLSEFVYETGKTYDANNNQTDVRAWGLTADLNYSLPWLEHLLKPGLVLQYATGSGRDSKTANPSNPAQEANDGNDNNFFYFGAYSAGLALKPKLSNLHIIRAGFQFRPLHYFYAARNLMVAFKYTYYRKVKADYSISDNDAKLDKPTVGQGLDLQAVWDFRSDVKLFYAYGLFLPSEAYDAATAKTLQIHIVSLNFLF